MIGRNGAGATSIGNRCGGGEGDRAPTTAGRVARGRGLPLREDVPRPEKGSHLVAAQSKNEQVQMRKSNGKEKKQGKTKPKCTGAPRNLCRNAIPPRAEALGAAALRRLDPTEPLPAESSLASESSLSS
jgi:hypothetical protein